MKAASLIAALTLTLASIAHASHVTVPGDYATIQAALDSPADTVFVGSGEYPEQLQVTRPLALLAAPSAFTSVPIVESIDIRWSGSPWNTVPMVMRGLRIRGPVTIENGPRKATITLANCQMDAGISAGPFNDDGDLEIRYCTIRGDAKLAFYRINFSLNNVLQGGVEILRFEGDCYVQGNQVEGASGIGILVRPPVYPPWVTDNTIRHCAVGASLPGGGHFLRNVVTDCSGDGYTGPQNIGYRSRLDVSANRFERCGRGIYEPNADATNVIEQNVVLNSVGDGISAVGQIFGNTVAGNGGNGISAPSSVSGRYGHGSSFIGGNVSAFNSGFGLLGRPGAIYGCNDWFGNGAGATRGTEPSATDIQLDPLFCDLAAGDVRVNASSPLVTAECGPIGAATVGCGTKSNAHEIHSPRAAELAVQVRGTIAEFSLVDSSPASFEVLDLQGRRVLCEEIAAPAAGQRGINFGARLSTGVYFVRLRQAGREAAGKAIVVR